MTTDVDHRAGILRAIPKGRAGVSLPLCPITRHVSWVLHRNGPRDVGRLFAVTKQLLRQDWREAREAIGRPGLLFKDLRHSFAQHLEDAGEGDLITDAWRMQTHGCGVATPRCRGKGSMLWAQFRAQ